MADVQQNVSHYSKDRSKNVKRSRTPSKDNCNKNFRLDNGGNDRGQERGRSGGRRSRERDNYSRRRERDERSGQRPEKDESDEANEKRGAFHPVTYRGSA